MLSKLNDFDLNKKRVFLRADLNVPLNPLQDFKLKSTLPTIDLINKKGGKIILATHIGRPKDKEFELSTKNLIPWFEQNGYKIDFESDLQKAYQQSFKDFDKILLLENLRFYDGEKENSKSNEFAKQLFKLGDFYVNDAFGVLHRKDTSVYLLPKLFDKEHKTIGLLVEKELKNLEKLKKPNHPFMLILGGAKIKDKLETLKTLLDKLDTIAILPAIIFTLLKAENKKVGKSLVDISAINFARKIENEIKEKNIKLIFPEDYLIAKDLKPKKLEIKKLENFEVDDIGISFGPETVKFLSNEIERSKTIFFNGLPGFTQHPETLKYVKELFEIMVKSKSYTVIGGGESVAAAIMLGFERKLNLSTGGGVILYYLSGKELPGLQYLN